jgi:hypothetical protein
MVKLRNIDPLTIFGLEMAYRFAHGVPELDLTEWLQTLPDAGERLLALDRLLDDENLFTTFRAPDQQSALRVTIEVIRTVMQLCRNREMSLEEVVEALMNDGAPPAGP